MGFQIPQINSFNCCSFKTASIIIGISKFILYLMYFIDISSYIIYYAKNENINKKTFRDFINLLWWGQSEFSMIEFSLILIYGALKEKSNFVMAWLIFSFTSVIDSFWNFGWNMIRFRKYFIQFTAFTVLDCLLMFVVFNYYRKLPKNKYVLH